MRGSVEKIKVLYTKLSPLDTSLQASGYRHCCHRLRTSPSLRPGPRHPRPNSRPLCSHGLPNLLCKTPISAFLCKPIDLPPLRGPLPVIILRNAMRILITVKPLPQSSIVRPSPMIKRPSVLPRYGIFNPCGPLRKIKAYLFILYL